MKESACKPIKEPIVDWKKHGGRICRGMKTLPLAALCIAFVGLLCYALLRLGVAIANMSKKCMTICDVIVLFVACLVALYFIGMGGDSGGKETAQC